MKECTFQATARLYSWEELSPEQQQLLTEAKQMTDSSYCPYSHFHVGAAARLDGGIIVRGANQENAAYPSGLCAERTTLFAANANYPNHAVQALAIACRKGDIFTSQPGAPCGACRQVMIETEHRFHTPMQVLLYGEDGTLVFEHATDLLPLGFFSDDLLG